MNVVIFGSALLADEMVPKRVCGRDSGTVERLHVRQHWGEVDMPIVRLFSVVSVTVLTLLLPSLAWGQITTRAGIELPAVSLPNTAQVTFSPKAMEHEVRVAIRVPESYANGDSEYPVIYAPDGDITFGLYSDVASILNLGAAMPESTHEIPEIIIVSIGYVGADTTEVMRLRAIDLTPSPMKMNPGSGEASKFLEFLADELIPYVNANFRTKADDRTLIGHSLGGLFTMYALFERPALFQRYVATSPSLWWDRRWMVTRESEYAEQHKALRAKVYIAAAQDEPLIYRTYTEMKGVLESRQYEGLELTAEVIQDETHSSVWPAAATRGLKAVFSEFRER